MNDGLLLTVFVPLAMFILMLGLGSTLNTQALKQALQNKTVLGMGLIAQIVLVPVCAAVVVFFVDMPNEFKLGIMLLACCPGGTTSNLFTHLGKGNLALSVALTTFSSLAVIITMPIILSISSELIFNQVREFDIPQLEILKRLFFMTILPIMIGIFISYRFPKLGKFISSKTGAFGLVFLIFLTGTVVINEWDNLLKYFSVIGTTIFLMNVSIVLVVMAMLKIALPSLQDRFTIYIEANIQSSALAMFIALTVLENGSMVAIPAGGYSLTMYFVGAILTVVHRHQKKKGLQGNHAVSV